MVVTLPYLDHRALVQALPGRTEFLLPRWRPWRLLYRLTASWGVSRVGLRFECRLFQKSTTKSTRNCFVHRWNGLTILRTGPRCQVTENTFIEDPPKCQFYDFTFSFLLRMRPAVIGRWQQFCPSQSAASFSCCDCCDSCAVHKFKPWR